MKSYYVIATCPDDSPVRDDTIWFLCEQVDNNDLFSTILVSGVKNNLPYRNVYCALCRGEDLADLESWSVNVECQNEFVSIQALGLLSNSTSRGTLDNIEGTLGCMVLAKSRELTASILRACYFGVVESCPEGHPLSEACQSYTAFVQTILPDFTFIENKNPHCAACNNEVRNNTDCNQNYPSMDVYVTPRPISCSSFTCPPIQSSPLPATKEPVVISAGLPPISIILDFRPEGNVKVVWQQEIAVQEHVTCSSNEVYDPFLLSCRKLSCNEGYVLEGDRCILKIKFAQHGLNMVIYMHVTVCTLEPSENGTDKVIRGCLAELMRVDERQFKHSTIAPTMPTVNCSPNEQQVLHPFMVQSNWQTFQEFHLSLQRTAEMTICSNDVMMQIVAVEMIYHNVNLSLSKCNGRWMNETHFYKNETGLVYVNESKSWYATNHTIQREILIRSKISGEFQWFHDLQLCQNPDLTCLLETFNSSLFHPNDNNETLVYTPTGDVFSRDQYIETWSGQIQVCSFNEKNGTRNMTEVITFFQYSPTQGILSLIGSILSMLAAIITFLTYCIFKELRNRTSGPIMNFTATLFIAQLLLLLSGVATVHPTICTIVAVSSHYCLIVNIMWTGVLAFNLYRTFVTKPTVRQKPASVSLATVSFAWGIPFLIVIPCLILHLCNCTDILLWYGNENVCWIGNGYVNILVVGVPIGMVISVNIFLFSFTVHGIRETNKNTKEVRKDKSTKQQAKEELVIYIKVSLRDLL